MNIMRISGLFIELDVLCVHLEGGAASVTVLLEIEADIDGVAVLQVVGLIAVSEGYAVHGNDGVREVQMEVPAFADSAGVAVIDEMTAEEQRTLVARTERLQTLKDLVHLPVHIAQFDLRLYI